MLKIHTEQIAEKFIEYYGRQAMPYLGKETLRQNKGKPPVSTAAQCALANHSCAQARTRPPPNTYSR
ncbi:MAG: hypothetical protein M3O31_12475 [Acidobacteriota bacterium]|nr:hypothetical protein [Acidobacteriota bacterium]